MDDALLSIQRVFLDCERKGVIPSVVDGLVNNERLQMRT
jgi:hypothetical protein